MNAQFEREFVKGIYPNPNWSEKVDKMDDDQVIAIFLRIKESPPDEQEPDQIPGQERLF